MRKVKITWLWRDYLTYYQIDDGENLSSLEMVVAELNDHIEPKINEQEELTEEYHKAITEDTFAIYKALEETNEMTYKGKVIKRTIDKEEFTDTEKVNFRYFGDKLVEALSWVKTEFVPMYKRGFSENEEAVDPPNSSLYVELVNNNMDNPFEYVSTFLRGINIQVMKK